MPAQIRQTGSSLYSHSSWVNAHYFFFEVRVHYIAWLTHTEMSCVTISQIGLGKAEVQMQLHADLAKFAKPSAALLLSLLAWLMR
jgi:hypothetical protein